ESTTRLPSVPNRSAACSGVAADKPMAMPRSCRNPRSVGSIPRQSSLTTVAPRARACSANASKRVDFPIPPIPWTETTCGPPSRTLSTPSSSADRPINASLARWAKRSPMRRIILFARCQSLHVLGSEWFPANSQIAALHLLDHDPGDLPHVLPFDTDHGVGQFFHHLPLLRVRKDAFNEFDIN